MGKISMKKINFYFFCFLLYAFIGWIYEVILEFYYGNGFVNRGFLHGPYLPVYGFGALLIIFSVYSLSKKKIYIGKLSITPAIVFILIFLLTTIVEYITGSILDLFLTERLWDYSHYKFNINGLVCLSASTRFAIGGTLFTYALQPLFGKFIIKIPSKLQNILFWILFGTILIDFIMTII